MFTRRPASHRGLAAVASIMGAAATMGVFAAASPAPTAAAAPCSQSISPLNPYQQTCGIPNDPPVVRGASPGAGAIIACRGVPGCLSAVVNGQPGYTRGGFRFGT